MVRTVLRMQFHDAHRATAVIMYHLILAIRNNVPVQTEMAQQVPIVLLTTQRNVLHVTTDFIYPAILVSQNNVLAQTEMAQQAPHAQPTMPQCVRPAVPDTNSPITLAC